MNCIVGQGKAGSIRHVLIVKVTGLTDRDELLLRVTPRESFWFGCESPRGVGVGGYFSVLLEAFCPALPLITAPKGFTLGENPSPHPPSPKINSQVSPSEHVSCMDSHLEPVPKVTLRLQQRFSSEGKGEAPHQHMVSRGGSDQHQRSSSAFSADSPPHVLRGATPVTTHTGDGKATLMQGNQNQSLVQNGSLKVFLKN